MEKNRIVSDHPSTSLVIAIDCLTKERILLFDASIHGYNGLFCDKNDPLFLASRQATTSYMVGKEFQIYISAQYGIDYENTVYEDFLDYVVDGQITTIAGQNIPFEVAKRNGFDYLEIVGCDKEGSYFEVVSTELA